VWRIVANKLSHSSINRFRQCGESYRLHYIERIRPTGTTSALVFGAALDNALNVLLTGTGNAEEEFGQCFTTTTINNEKIYIPTSEIISYSTADYDRDLLDANDLKEIEEYTEKSRALRGDNLPPDLIRNYASWHCLRQKGLLMIRDYREKVLPRITKVHAVQRTIALDNGSGDKVTGLVDLVAGIDEHPLCILDNKSTSRPYDNDSARNSEQLALYLHALESEFPTRMVGYIVLNKKVRKNKTKICQKCGVDGSTTAHKTCNNMIDGVRCHGEFDITIDPEIDVQIIVDEMPESVEQTVLANVDTVNTMINDKVFDKNEKSCNNWYGKQCPHFGLCHGGSMKGLVKV
jgi:PD-(D/E)XK nuclease superfamily